MRGNRSSGFHVVEVVLVGAVIVVVGFVGWRVWDASRTKTEVPPAEAVANAVPVINSTNDLDTVDAFIGNLDTSAEQEELTKLDQEFGSL